MLNTVHIETANPKGRALSRT